MSGRYAVMFFRDAANMHVAGAEVPLDAFVMPSGRFPGLGSMSVPSGTALGLDLRPRRNGKEGHG